MFVEAVKWFYSHVTMEVNTFNYLDEWATTFCHKMNIFMEKWINVCPYNTFKLNGAQSADTIVSSD